MKDAFPNCGAFWNNKLWYLEKSLPAGPFAQERTTIKTMSLERNGNPENVVELPVESAWLIKVRWFSHYLTFTLAKSGPH